ncbi:hypothetical protein [Streptomyces sp. SD15]
MTGQRSDEIARLRVGCIRWQHDGLPIPGDSSEVLTRDAVCLLDVPTHKTGTAFTKPVDPLLGQAIEAWQAVRPAQPPMLDRKTNEHVDFHGWCTYTFFEQCQHRMACARCDFYTPKDSSKGQLQEAKENLQKMLAAIPLTVDEQAAVQDGQLALDRLLDRLADVPTPVGPTPRELGPLPPPRCCP